MPESPPSDDNGPDPYEGQDLDGLLSGASCYVPEELLKVIPALDALRAAPRGAELFGELEARAAFRRLRSAGRSEPAFASEPAFTAAAGGDARTLILPPVTAAGAEPHVVRRRPSSHRRPPKRGRWRAKALVGVVAVAVAAGGVTALASTLSSPGGRPAASAPRTSAASTATASAAPGSRGVDGGGSPVPSAKPARATPRRSPANTPSPAQLCRQYFDKLAATGWHVRSAGESKLYQELRPLAKGRGGVNYYCMRQLEPWEMPQRSGALPDPLSNGGPGQQGSQGSPVTAGFPRKNPNGNGANGNGQGRNGPGFPGNQGQP